MASRLRRVGDDDIADMSFLPDGNEPRRLSVGEMVTIHTHVPSFTKDRSIYDFRPMPGGGEYDSGSIPPSREQCSTAARRCDAGPAPHEYCITPSLTVP